MLFKLAEGITTTGLADGISEAIATITSVVQGVITTITSNPLLMLFVGVSLIGTGIGIFSALKRA